MTETELMLTTIRNCRRIDLYIDRQPLTDKESDQLNKMQIRRNEGEPLQYIIGCCEFMGLRLIIDKRVFIPRPETELLVEAAIDKAKLFQNCSLKILDLGTGSGNIAISLAKYLEGAHITAVDISQDAIDLAILNAKTNNVDHKINFIRDDLFFPLAEEGYVKNAFDIIISNPPYISTSEILNLPLEVRREPLIALDGGEEGVRFYQRIISESGCFLTPGGLLLLELGYGQKQLVCDMFYSTRQFQVTDCLKDCVDIDRVIVAKLAKD